MNAAAIIGFLVQNLESQGAVASIEIRHDLGALATGDEGLVALRGAITEVLGSAEYDDGSKRGYGDGQMIWQTFGVPVANFGPIGGNAHRANEWVDVDSLTTTRNIFANMIRRSCKTSS